jgi:Xaa-Pro aminopeptidase
MSSFLERRRERVAAAWNLTREVVLIGAGEAQPIPGGADQTYPYLSHSEYFYLADRDCPGGVVAFDPTEGWVDFVPEVTEAERVWEGKTDTEGVPVSALAGWIGARRGRPLAMLGTPLPGVRADPARSAELREALTHARRPKDEVELDRMRRAASATAAGFAVAGRMIQPGTSEREIQVELEAEFFRRGADRTGYATIVGAGSNSAVLHFSPTSRRLQPGDNVLIDAGADVGRYVIDVTRTYHVGDAPTGMRRDLHRLVLEVEERAIARCTPGAEWREIHLQAAQEIAAGLVAIGILRGDPGSLVERDVPALFFPHGIGHMVGLGVRDGSGYLPGRTPSKRPGLSMLRTDLPLEPGYVMTVEPGIYFIPALLGDPERRARHRDAVDWGRVDGLLDFGGIRIEDNVLVREAGPEVLTAAIPRTG